MKKKEKSATPLIKPRKTLIKIVREAPKKEIKKIPPKEEASPGRGKRMPAPQEVKPAREKEKKAPEPKSLHKAKKPVTVHIDNEQKRRKVFVKQHADKRAKRLRTGKTRDGRQSWKEDKIATARMNTTEITIPRAIKRRIKNRRSYKNKRFLSLVEETGEVQKTIFSKKTRDGGSVLKCLM